MSNFELNRELQTLNTEREQTKQILEQQNQKIAEMLKGAMGSDIRDVTSGNVKIKLSFKEKLRYKIKSILDNMFSIF